MPLGQVLALAIEDLDAIVFAVAHEDPTIGMDPRAVGQAELARARARLAP